MCSLSIYFGDQNVVFLCKGDYSKDLRAEPPFHDDVLLGSE